MRIWMKPDVMAQYKLIPSDITGVLAEQNIESAAGMFGENSDNTFQYTMKYRGRKMTPEEFGEIVIRATSDGQVLRLKDVADIELGQDSYAYHGMVNGHPAFRRSSSRPQARTPHKPSRKSTRCSMKLQPNSLKA